MRLSQEQVAMIRQVVEEAAGVGVGVRLFGSRLNDELKGGDIDLLIELNEVVERPAILSAQIASRISRRLDGRHVDVVIAAPNLNELPIHRIARQGQLL